MVSILTASTVSIMQQTGPLALVGMLVLLGLLVQKELASTTRRPWLKRLDKILNIAIAPLLLVFALLVAAMIAKVLQ